MCIKDRKDPLPPATEFLPKPILFEGLHFNTVLHAHNGLCEKLLQKALVNTWVRTLCWTTVEGSHPTTSQLLGCIQGTSLGLVLALMEVRPCIGKTLQQPTSTGLLCAGLFCSGTGTPTCAQGGRKLYSSNSVYPAKGFKWHGKPDVEVLST